MNSKKISVSQPWLYQTYPYNPQISNITTLIKNTFLKFGILTSQIYVSEYPKLFVFHFTVFGNNQLLTSIINYLNSILTIKYNKNIIFDFKYSPSLYHDDLILSSWLKLKLQQDPNKLRMLIKKIVSKKDISQKKFNNPKTLFNQPRVNWKKRDFINIKSYQYHNNAK